MTKKIVRLVRFDSIYSLLRKDIEINGDPIIVPLLATQRDMEHIAIFEVREKEEEIW